MEEMILYGVPDVFVNTSKGEVPLRKLKSVREHYINGMWYLYLEDVVKVFSMEEHLTDFKDCAIRVDWIVKSIKDGHDYTCPNFYYNCVLVEVESTADCHGEPIPTTYIFRCSNKTKEILC